jgi:hypothetical protein
MLCVFQVCWSFIEVVGVNSEGAGVVIEVGEVIIGVPVIGPAVYYYTEKKHEYAKVPSHHIHESETEIQHEATPKHHDRKEEKHVVQEDVKVEVQAEEKQKEKVDKKEETVNEENK